MGFFKRQLMEKEQTAPLYEEYEFSNWFEEEMAGYFETDFEDLQPETQNKVRSIADFLIGEFGYLPDKYTGSEFDQAGAFFMIREKLGIQN